MVPFTEVVTNGFKSRIIKFRNAKLTGKQGKSCWWKRKGKIKISLYDFYSKMCVNVCVCVCKCVFERDVKSKQAFKRFDEIKRLCQ